MAVIDSIQIFECSSCGKCISLPSPYNGPQYGEWDCSYCVDDDGKRGTVYEVAVTPIGYLGIWDEVSL